MTPSPTPAAQLPDTEFEIDGVTTTEPTVAGPQIRVLSKLEVARFHYPKSGTGLRQGARLERQKRRGLLDFSASVRCIQRIREKVGASA